MVSQTSPLASHMPPPKKLNYPQYEVTKPNAQHQFDVLYIPHVFEGNIYKYILTCIDVASRYKVARRLVIKKNNQTCFCVGTNL